jgi:hypothetical protein
MSNSWYTNILSAACLILSYAAASQVWILSANNPNYTVFDPLPGGSSKQETMVLNSIALAALGIGILGQALISTWCMLRNSKQILTWSSNPLNTTLACLHSVLTPRPGRCMLAVHSAHLPSVPSKPLHRQLSASKADRSVWYILLFIWFLFPLTVFWGSAILRSEEPKLDLSLVPPSNFNPKVNNDVDMSPFSYHDDVSLNPPVATQLIYSLLIVAAIQVLQTLGLHSVELLANLSRDESTWRCANAGIQPRLNETSAGVYIRSSSFKTAITSWQTMVLFALKPIIHWLFGICITTYRSAYYSVGGAPDMEKLSLLIMSSSLCVSCRFSLWPV